MTLKELRTLPTVELVNKLNDEMYWEDWNHIIYEITCRMYIPFQGPTFEELLIKNGYIINENAKNKTI